MMVDKGHWGVGHLGKVQGATALAVTPERIWCLWPVLTAASQGSELTHCQPGR